MSFPFTKKFSNISSSKYKYELFRQIKNFLLFQLIPIMTQNILKALQNMSLKYSILNTKPKGSLLSSNSYPTMKN